MRSISPSSTLTTSISTSHAGPVAATLSFEAKTKDNLGHDPHCIVETSRILTDNTFDSYDDVLDWLTEQCQDPASPDKVILPSVNMLHGTAEGERQPRENPPEEERAIEEKQTSQDMTWHHCHHHRRVGGYQREDQEDGG